MTPVLLALSALAVGILCAIVTQPVANSLNEVEIELSGLSQMIIERRWILPLFAIPPFLLSMLMLVTSRYRWPIMIVSAALLLIPVAAVLHLFTILLSVVYESPEPL